MSITFLAAFVDVRKPRSSHNLDLTPGFTEGISCDSQINTYGKEADDNSHRHPNGACTVIHLCLNISTVVRVTALLLCLLWCMGCTSSDVLHIDSSRLEADVVFFVKTNKKTNEISILGESARSPAEFQTTPLVRFNLETNDESVHIIGITTAVLKKHVTMYDAQRKSELQLRRRSDVSARARDLAWRDLDSSFTYLALEPTSGELIPSTQELIDRIIQDFEILIPLDLESCRNPESEKLKLFYASGSECSQSYLGLHRVDEKRFIGVSDKFIQVFQRGEANDCGTLSSSVSGSRGTRLRLKDNENNFAIGTKKSDDGSYLVVTAVNERNGEDPVAYHITERRLFADGFGPPTFAKTMVPEDFSNLTKAEKIFITDVEVGTDDTAYVVFSEGTIFVRSPNEVDYSRFTASEFAATPMRRYIRGLEVRANQESPHLLSTEGSLFLGNIREDQWKTISLEPLEQVLSPWDMTFRSDPSLSEVYFVGNDGSQGWFGGLNNDEPFEISVLYPERLSGCITRGRFNKVRALAVNEKAIFGLPDCNTVVRIRHKDRCASFINFEDNPKFELGTGELRGIILYDDQLFVAGRDKKIYEFSLENFDKDIVSDP